jgi:site-specific DNA-methyltransferase (adenine-specific)
LRADIIHGDNLRALRELESGSYSMIYIDPPFNTGTVQRRTTKMSYSDSFDDYMGFLDPRLREAHRLLKPDGSLFFHIDYREVHYCKVLLDSIFGRASFQNEIIWAYDYGARTKKKWPAKHDNILWYSKDPEDYVFNYDEMDRIPYMAPGLVGPEKAARGKTPTDSWWHTIVSPNGKEKTGYPTQKPRGLLDRFVKVHSNPGDSLLDFFAGSGSFGESAIVHGRNVTLIDSNTDAIDVMLNRMTCLECEVHLLFLED